MTTVPAPTTPWIWPPVMVVSILASDIASVAPRPG
jgi:hypothetical protein